MLEARVEKAKTEVESEGRRLEEIMKKRNLRGM
jgi:hypothetical protein